MSEKRRPGGQPGNQNGRTHGFYSKTLNPEMRRGLDAAAGVEGLDQEIALLRLKISAFAGNPDHYRLLIPGMSLLSRLLRTRQKLGYDTQDQLQAAVRNVLRDLPLPAGFSPSDFGRLDLTKPGGPALDRAEGNGS